MRIFKFLTSLIFFIFITSFTSEAQDGIIRGTVTDESNGDALISVTVLAEGTSKGITTDLDGKFNLPIESGTYNIRFSYVSYETKVISDVTVKPGEVTLLDNIVLRSSTVGLSEVTVSARAMRNNEVAVTKIRMNSPSLTDGISAASFRKMGDSDAGS